MVYVCTVYDEQTKYRPTALSDYMFDFVLIETLLSINSEKKLSSR